MPLFFGKIGNLQLPMEFPGIWLLPTVIYFISLFFSIKNILRRKISARSGFILFTTLLGCGALSYYVGRSHQNNLLFVSYPCAILLGIAASSLKADKAFRNAAVFIMVLFAFLGFFNTDLFNSENRERNFFKGYFNRLVTDVEKQLDDNRYLIYTGPLEALIAIELNAKPAFAHHAIEEIVFKKDCVEYAAKIEHSPNNTLWVINYDFLNRHTPESLKEPVKQLLRKRLGVKDIPNAMFMLRL